MIYNETIVSQITCPGKSAVGILRISGIQAKTVAVALLGQIPVARFATYSRFLDKNNQILDTGIALWFPTPHSFTGEDVLELQGHGSPLIIDLLIKRILSISKDVRIAKPGEFSERAFLNGKMDLIQAESIDDLINAETESSLRASLHSLQGNFSFFIKELINLIIEFRVYIESNIDFSEEDIDINIEDIVNIKFEELDEKFFKIQKTAEEGNLLREGKKIIIVGAPNAGKSSLLNILSSSNRAIVTNIPGTTRDLLYEHININGITCELIDTAGLRHTKNKVENIGIVRALKEIKKSDHIIFVIDKTMNIPEQKKIYHEFIFNLLHYKVPITFALNKNDLVQSQCYVETIKDASCIHISAKTGEGIDILRAHIMKVEKNISVKSIFLARRRHINQINLAYKEFLSARKEWKLFKNVECLAESLNIIQRFLDEITGKYTSSDLLNNIFSNFCIGK
ncbi:tRNA uridine-5-carboxymethylaminomethyl(34) synthesis GTPase MnmE [Buchnera aphidicola (Macrosiphoniella sanborni)]|uniref:tRNA modification GTPase MnmE n=1 Tax=Buchnera aphidicola (Macrosiphoniella sanborni) TaxID=1241865 RepID=A0A4D6YGX0_9GAMM|nr:tRNA uridine-5-carboxymethylaminomethyl(34) synthesis GTPase MnmE [Buchnera aphidicola]QCI23595.1 tRNA uridine-5-carboxymethylaminomethyl(34) synthesis GTPase MnmE [Buchnera aphidicola (Macrosiphoniella sanborni)]